MSKHTTTKTLVADFNSSAHALSTFVAEYSGAPLGWGLYRTVYEARTCPSVAIKVARDKAGRSSNFWEWEIWNFIKGHPQSKWLAPCFAISDDFSVLLMARTSPCEVRIPRIPDWITDTKTSNWGMLRSGRVVCHDYSTTLLFNQIMVPTMKKAQWWRANQ